MPWLTRLSILALFLLAASAAWWLDTTREPQRDAVPTSAAAALPDYWFADFQLARYRASGPPRQLLLGRRLEHYPATRTAELEQPRLTHQPAAGPLWRVRAERGTLHEQSDVVELHDDVHLHRRGDAQRRGFTLLTPRLTYEMGPEVARTEQPVRMYSVGTRVTATGMTARLAEEEVDLLAAVRVVHDPGLTGEAPADD